MHTSIEQYHAQLKEGKLNCLDTVKHYLREIQSKKQLNAFIEVFEEEALAHAKVLDEQRAKGSPLKKLHGVIIGIKDVLCYKDHHVSAASRILENFVSIYTATSVQRLLDEDAIIIGRLNCDEFAMGSTNENSAYGKVLNALDETRVPGGSSGGSAVAVQAGLCMVSLGSDTGGSVRQPADFCGIIGMKPTYGAISRYGLIAYASSFDQVGVFAKDIRDVALLLSIMEGADEFDSTVSDREVPDYPALLDSDQKFRFAYFEEALIHPGIDHEISDQIKSKLDELKGQGHQVNAVSFDLLDYIVPAYYILTTAEASSNLSRYDGVRYGYRSSDTADPDKMYKQTRCEAFGIEVKRRIMLGTFVLSAGYFDAYFTRALQVRRLLFNKLKTIFEHYDFVLMPTSPFTAVKAGSMKDPIAMYLSDIYTVMANLTGCPAISVPLFKHSNGMPFSLQVMSNHNNEVSLLRISKQLMDAVH